jgi:hypothetical protein
VTATLMMTCGALEIEILRDTEDGLFSAVALDHSSAVQVSRALRPALRPTEGRVAEKRAAEPSGPRQPCELCASCESRRSE